MPSAYCSETDIVNGGLRQSAVDELSDPDALIQRASALIDTYLRGRYKLPFAITPLEIKNCCVQIVLWYCLESLGWDPESKVDSSIRMGHDDAVSWLKRVSDGKAHLDVTADATPDINEGIPRVRSNPRNEGLRGNGRI
jgi:phage gp36-like protein